MAVSVTPLSVIEYWNVPVMAPPLKVKLNVPSPLLATVPPLTEPATSVGTPGLGWSSLASTLSVTVELVVLNVSSRASTRLMCRV